MSGKKIIYIVVFASITLFLTFSAWANDAQKPKYAADVPEFLLIPDSVETEVLGTLDFFDGMPSESTVKKTYDFLDLSRGVDAFLNGMPAASISAFLEGLKEAGLKPGDLGITENLLDARGRAFGESRVVCNVHWHSDVVEGRFMGAAAVARLHADPAFPAELAAAKSELAAARSRSLAPSHDCQAETEALEKDLFPKK